MSVITEIKKASRYLLTITSFVLSAIAISSCGDDPEPVNEEEVITTMNVVLTPTGGGNPVTLRFYDADGDGSIAPVKSINGTLLASKTYTGIITLLNESQASPVDISAEVKEEDEHHLFCFTVTGSLSAVTANDTDSKGLPVGLSSTWVTTSPGSATVKIVLRHQFETKTGACPGTGETDLEVDFNVVVQ